MFEPSEVHQQILYDLMSRYLEPLNGSYERLAYVAGLRNAATGIYEHEGLAAVYPPDTVNDILARCHEELFERLLEMPLAAQEEDLRKYTQVAVRSEKLDSQQTGRPAQEWIPPQAPEYLKELYRSNLRALGELLQDCKPKARSDS